MYYELSSSLEFLSASLQGRLLLEKLPLHDVRLNAGRAFSTDRPREHLEHYSVCYLRRITSYLVVLDITCFTTKGSFSESKIESFPLSFGFIQCETPWAFSRSKTSGSNN
ncbi:hypothetical protein J6590_076075 [Homalodisca vitripennis]|nr:hypothetical protein J6590_076072 [Homalodisca vitripennis]KAG8335131.1 hypothetical protein J6590_076075 [Homalodisca vitripennis]